MKCNIGEDILKTCNKIKRVQYKKNWNLVNACFRTNIWQLSCINVSQFSECSEFFLLANSHPTGECEHPVLVLNQCSCSTHTKCDTFSLQMHASLLRFSYYRGIIWACCISALGFCEVTSRAEMQRNMTAHKVTWCHSHAPLQRLGQMESVKHADGLENWKLILLAHFSPL